MRLAHLCGGTFCVDTSLALQGKVVARDLHRRERETGTRLKSGNSLFFLSERYRHGVGILPVGFLS